MRVDSDPWALVPTYPDWTFRVDCDRLSAEEHVFLARSTDGMEYSQVHQINFTVVRDDVTEYPAGGGVEDDAGIPLVVPVIGAAAMVIAVALVVFALVSNRRGGDGPFRTGR